MNDLRDTERQLSNLLHETTPEPPPSIDLHALARTAKTPSRRTNRHVVRRWAAPLVAAAAVLGAIAGGLAIVVGGGTAVPGSGQLDAAAESQARKALAHWEAAVKANPALAVIPTTQQVGEWEPAVAAKYAKAFEAGLLAENQLDRLVPPPGKITWASGEVRTTAVLSADATRDGFRTTGFAGCPCEPLVVTRARLTTMTVQTSRGPATVPAWRFSLQGTKVELLRSAVSTPTVKPLPQVPNNPHIWYYLYTASVAADDRTLTVLFDGAVKPGNEPCGADYTAHAVESDQAVVIVIVEHRNRYEGACPMPAMGRTATVELPNDLAGRAIVQLPQGVPVPITPAG